MDIFVQLSIVIVVTVLITGLARLLKQPLTVGYILSGFVLAPFLTSTFNSKETLDIFSEMGIAILLFIVGLHLSPREVKDFAKSSFLIGFFQVLLTATLGFYLSVFLRIPVIESIYVGISLAFSSTIIVLKLISDKKDLEKLYGRIAVGILLFQDVVAIFALIFSSAFVGGNTGVLNFAFILIKGLVFMSLVYLFGNYVLPKFGDFFAKSQEYLLLFSLGWGFGLASLFRYLGFSVEIGALVAGVSLAISPYSQEISSRLRPLRDFFVVMFFVSLGSQIDLKVIPDIWPQVIIFTLFVLIIKALIVISLMGQFRYNKKTAFLEGISLAQLSEFSLVLLILGQRSGHVSQETFSIILLTGILTIGVSTYLIMYAEKIYPLFAKYLRIFEQRAPVKEKSIAAYYEVVLFGCNRVGYDFVRMFKDFGAGFLAVDFDPAIISALDKEGINCVYGDAEDGEFLEDVAITKAKIVVSTIPDYDTNNFLLTKIRNANVDSLVVVLSYNVDDALKLYEKGASYVVLPHFISGEFAADLTFKAGLDKKEIHKRRQEHLDYLHQRKNLGHSHPKWSHNV